MKNTLYILLLFSLNINAQQLAFPSAYGDGAYTTGGRVGTVYHVTSLLDDGSVGTLRDALSVGNRTIVFDVSGVINLTNNIGIPDNTTIAGQTAPEGGITIDGNRFYVYNATNIIVRYIRFSGGIDVNNDSVTVVGSIQNHIWDHCTFAFGGDEAGSWYTASELGSDQNNITIQRCLFNENPKASILGKNEIVGGNPPTTSFLFNMFYNSGYRFPNVSTSNAGQFDIINNISWTVTNRLIRGNGNFNLNHIGNYYDYGNGQAQNSRTNLFAYASGVIPQIYNSNNKFTGSEAAMFFTLAEMTADGDKSWGFFLADGGYSIGDRLPVSYFTATQHTLLGKTFTPLTADEAFVSVSNDVGCNARLNADGSISDNLDTLDTTALTNVVNGIYTDKLLSSSYNVSPITSVARGGTYDTDNDGMADTWETATFGDLTRTGTLDFDSDGYTDLEEFLNLVDGAVAPPTGNINYTLSDRQKRTSKRIIKNKLIRI
jgi:hypothetical protein